MVWCVKRFIGCWFVLFYWLLLFEVGDMIFLWKFNYMKKMLFVVVLLVLVFFGFMLLGCGMFCLYKLWDMVK